MTRRNRHQKHFAAAFRRLLCAALALAFALGSAPAYALREQQTEDPAGLEEIARALTRGEVKEAGRRFAAAIGLAPPIVSSPTADSPAVFSPPSSPTGLEEGDWRAKAKKILAAAERYAAATGIKDSIEENGTGITFADTEAGFVDREPGDLRDRIAVLRDEAERIESRRHDNIGLTLGALLQRAMDAIPLPSAGFVAEEKSPQDAFAPPEAGPPNDAAGLEESEELVRQVAAEFAQRFELPAVGESALVGYLSGQLNIPTAISSLRAANPQTIPTETQARNVLQQAQSALANKQRADVAGLEEKYQSVRGKRWVYSFGTHTPPIALDLGDTRIFLVALQDSPGAPVRSPFLIKLNGKGEAAFFGEDQFSWSRNPLGDQVVLKPGAVGQAAYQDLAPWAKEISWKDGTLTLGWDNARVPPSGLLYVTPFQPSAGLEEVRQEWDEYMTEVKKLSLPMTGVGVFWIRRGQLAEALAKRYDDDALALAAFDRLWDGQMDREGVSGDLERRRREDRITVQEIVRKLLDARSLPARAAARIQQIIAESAAGSQPIEVVDIHLSELSTYTFPAQADVSMIYEQVEKAAQASRPPLEGRVRLRKVGRNLEISPAAGLEEGRRDDAVESWQPGEESRPVRLEVAASKLDRWARRGAVATARFQEAVLTGSDLGYVALLRRLRPLVPPGTTLRLRWEGNGEIHILPAALAAPSTRLEESRPIFSVPNVAASFLPREITENMLQPLLAEGPQPRWDFVSDGIASVEISITNTAAAKSAHLQFSPEEIKQDASGITPAVSAALSQVGVAENSHWNIQADAGRPDDSSTLSVWIELSPTAGLEETEVNLGAEIVSKQLWESAIPDFLRRNGSSGMWVVLVADPAPYTNSVRGTVEKDPFDFPNRLVFEMQVAMRPNYPELLPSFNVSIFSPGPGVPDAVSKIAVIQPTERAVVSTWRARMNEALDRYLQDVADDPAGSDPARVVDRAALDHHFEQLWRNKPSWLRFPSKNFRELLETLSRAKLGMDDASRTADGQLKQRPAALTILRHEAAYREARGNLLGKPAAGLEEDAELQMRQWIDRQPDPGDLSDLEFGLLLDTELRPRLSRHEGERILEGLGYSYVDDDPVGRWVNRSAGLEEKKLMAEPAAGAANRLMELIAEVGDRVPSAAETVQPLRLLVDTSEGDPRVLRLAELAVRLRMERPGFPIEAAGVATGQELNAALAELPDEMSRGFLRSRIFTYKAGDEASRRQALELLAISFPAFGGIRPITSIDEETIQTFLAQLRALGVAIDSFAPAFLEEIRSFLTSRTAA